MLDPRNGDYFPWLYQAVNGGVYAIESDDETSDSWPSDIDHASDYWFDAANPQEGDEFDVFSEGSGMYDTEDDDSLFGFDPANLLYPAGPL